MNATLFEVLRMLEQKVVDLQTRQIYVDKHSSHSIGNYLQRSFSVLEKWIRTERRGNFTGTFQDLERVNKQDFEIIKEVLLW